MEQFAGSIVYLEGNVVKARIFVCVANFISEALEKLTEFIADLGIPEDLVVDTRLNKIKSPNDKAYIGAFATFTKPGGFKADFVMLYAQDEKKFAEAVVAGYKRSITPTTVIVESMDIRLLSEF